jgi:hypothetical protein
MASFGVPIQDVVSPHHLVVFTETGVGQQVRMDVYTGWAGVNYDAGSASTVRRDEWVSFLPHDTMRVLSYQEGSLRDFTVTAAPSAVADVEEEAAVAAVDSASVALEPQQFVGVGGTKWCLILRANLAVLNATLHAFTYQITVVVPAVDEDGTVLPVESHAISQGTIPA